jgi:peptidoglycan hydrolase CwlO-like protein
MIPQIDQILDWYTGRPFWKKIIFAVVIAIAFIIATIAALLFKKKEDENSPIGENLSTMVNTEAERTRRELDELKKERESIKRDVESKSAIFELLDDEREEKHDEIDRSGSFGDIDRALGIERERGGSE